MQISARDQSISSPGAAVCEVALRNWIGATSAFLNLKFIISTKTENAIEK